METAPNIQPKQGLTSVILMSLFASAFAFIIIKDINIPSPIIAGCAVIGGVILFLKGMQKPELVTYALVAYLPFSKMLSGDFGGLATAFNVTNLLMAFIILVWMNDRNRNGEPVWRATSLNFPIYLFMFMGFVSIVRANSSDSKFLLSAAIDYKRWLTPILMYFLVLNTVRDRVTIKHLCIIIMIVTTIVGLMAIYDYFEVSEMSSLDKSRIGGIADQPNMLAAFFNYYMFLPFGFLLLNMKKKRYWLLLIPFLICFRGIMVTFSRGGYLAFAAGLFAVSFFKSKWSILLMIALSVLIYLNPVLMPEGIRYRLGQTLENKANDSDEEINESNLDTSARTRVEIWKGAIQMIKDNPLFGVGYDMFQSRIVPYWEGEREIDAHNTYLIIAAEMGIPTLLVFLWIIGITFHETHMLYKVTQDPFSKAIALGFLGGLFGLLVSNMFGSRLDSQEVSSYFWILAALVVRLRILDAKEQAGFSSVPMLDQVGPQEAKQYKRQTLDAVWAED